MYDMQFGAFHQFANLPQHPKHDRNTFLVAPALAKFRSAQFSGRVKMLLGRLMGRSHGLRDLEREKRFLTVVSGYSAGLKTVPICRIQGSEGRSRDFDADFHPLHELSRERWIGIAIARRSGNPMPPAELIQVGDSYFVRDGHHRISVARAFGEEFIEAEVTVWVLAEEPAVNCEPQAVPASV